MSSTSTRRTATRSARRPRGIMRGMRSRRGSQDLLCARDSRRGSSHLRGCSVYGCPWSPGDKNGTIGLVSSSSFDYECVRAHNSEFLSHVKSPTSPLSKNTVDMNGLALPAPTPLRIGTIWFITSWGGSGSTGLTRLVRRTGRMSSLTHHMHDRAPPHPSPQAAPGSGSYRRSWSRSERLPASAGRQVPPPRMARRR